MGRRKNGGSKRSDDQERKRERRKKKDANQPVTKEKKSMSLQQALQILGLDSSSKDSVNESWIKDYVSDAIESGHDAAEANKAGEVVREAWF